MPNLKDLKTRIGSVKSTQKITRAMKVVAASKLRRAQENAEKSRPYTERMERMMVTLAQGISPEIAPPLLAGRGGEVKKHLLIVATADRGLCGGFNSSIVKAAKRCVVEYQEQDKELVIITVGKKGSDQLNAGQGGYNIVDHVDTSNNRAVEYSAAESLAEKAIALFENGEVDSCSIVYNEFKSAILQEVKFQKLIPLEVPEVEEKKQGATAVYEYEPSEETILAELLPLNIAIQIFGSLLENSASEQGARMTAMDNATRNAGEMIDKLSLVYNRTRQAAITTELTEIISGAEAV